MRSSARESAAIYRETGDLQGTGRALSLWAIGERVLGSAAEGRALLEQGATIAREIDDRWGLAYALGQLGPSAQRAGDLDAARALRAESATLAREVGERHVLGLAVAGLAALDLVEGNLGSATTRFKEALTVSMEIEDALILPRSLAGLASIASRQADHQRATRLLARAQAQRDATGTREVRSWREIFDSDIVDVRAALGAEAFAAAWAEGRAMTLEQVVAYALDEQP